MNTPFAEQVERLKAVADAALERCLPPADLAPVEVHQAMRYALLSGGKRLRPVLALAVAELAGRPAESVLDAACAFECLHAASLILDDLPCMDDAKTRRGRPCTHIRFGEATAVLAALALTVKAFELVARNARAAAPSCDASVVVADLAQAVGSAGLIGGQSLDLAFDDTATDPGALEQVHGRKTGALFVAAVRIPARLVGLAPREMESLETYATALGLVFQITDDLLDAHPGADHKDGTSCLACLGEDGARRQVEALTRTALEAMTALEGRQTAFLRQLAQHVQTRTA